MLKLITFTSDSDKTVLTFNLKTGNLDHDVSLTKDKHGGWSARMISAIRPGIGNTPDEAIKELGTQLFRLSDIIAEEDGNFGTIDLSKVLT